MTIQSLFTSVSLLICWTLILEEKTSQGRLDDLKICAQVCPKCAQNAHEPVEKSENRGEGIQTDAKEVIKGK
jgi:hypothetical protein